MCKLLVATMYDWVGQLKCHLTRSKNVDVVFSFVKEHNYFLLNYHKTNIRVGDESNPPIILHTSADCNGGGKVWRK